LPLCNNFKIIFYKFEIFLKWSYNYNSSIPVQRQRRPPGLGELFFHHFLSQPFFFLKNIFEMENN